MIHAVFYAYTPNEVGAGYSDNYYPHEYRKVIVYDNAADAINAYANTPCPASQLINAKDNVDLEKQIKQMHENFDSKEWLEENLFPYL